jgi:undecaprenyl-diphosphatase
MSELVKPIILGIIQGLTEFLPVSSSGHLEIAKFLFGDQALAEESLLMTVILHAGTALSTILVFRKDLLYIFMGLLKKGWNDDKAFCVKIVVSMIPAALIGFFLESEVAMLFTRQMALVGAMLIVTAILLIYADKAKTTDRKVNYRDAIIVGVAQAFAILPGLSRSGATISATVLLGIDRYRAARFSFLMVVPLILGKIAYDFVKGDFIWETAGAPGLIAGFTASLIAGLLACKLMLRLVKLSRLSYFAIYCIIIGLAAIGAFFFMR